MIDRLKHHWNVSSRREFFTRAGSGLAGLALASMLTEQGKAAGVAGRDPLAPRTPDHQPTAKSVIFLFMEGGPSHVDLFDYKPLLYKLDGKPIPDSIGKPAQTSRGTANNTLMAPKRKFAQYGQSGLWVSDWYPNIAQHADDLAVIRSCWADGLNHVGSVCQMNTGAILAGRPSMGAWVTYGLGTANRNLPTFVVLSDGRDPLGASTNWSSGFLPAVYQGTRFRTGNTPILDLKRPDGVSDQQQKNELGLLAKLDELWSADKSDDTELDARTRSFELAYQMQSAASDAVDLSKESAETKAMYGIDNPTSAVFGTNCLLARKLVERGVRFVELYSGGGSGWDAHNNIEGNHTHFCAESDKPIAGLLYGPEGPRHAEGYAGRLGRRIRAHPVQRAEHRPRSQSLGFLHVDGGRRRQGRPICRRHRRNRPARRGAAGPCPRHPCDHSLVDGSGSYAAHLSA